MDEDKEGGKRRPGRFPSNSSNFHSAESKTSETTGNVRTEKKEKRIYSIFVFLKKIFFSAKRVVVQSFKMFSDSRQFIAMRN